MMAETCEKQNKGIQIFVLLYAPPNRRLGSSGAPGVEAAKPGNVIYSSPVSKTPHITTLENKISVCHVAECRKGGKKEPSAGFCQQAAALCLRETIKYTAADLRRVFVWEAAEKKSSLSQ